MGYVDDLRAIGYTTEQAWEIARRVAPWLQYLGVQDAPRKRRLDNGPWAGTIFVSTCDSVGKTVTQAKWDKAKSYVRELQSAIDFDPKSNFDFKRLEIIQGFLCHLAMTYSILFPYLKVFHLVLAQHLAKRNDEGWKLTDNEWVNFVNHKLSSGSWSQNKYDQYMINSKRLYRYEDHPLVVRAYPRFIQSISALTNFLSVDQPPIVLDRCFQVNMIIYGFSDASGTGSGSTLCR